MIDEAVSYTWLCSEITYAASKVNVQAILKKGGTLHA